MFRFLRPRRWKRETDIQNEVPEDQTQERDTWVGRFDFLMSCIGYGIGIGDLLRFPYLFVRNGGGAFLIPFLVFLALCGFPLFYLEVALGQFSSESCLTVWKIAPLFKGIGWSMVIVSGILSLYYIMMIVWTLYYLVRTLHPDLPWSICGHHWNTELCTTHNSLNISICDIENCTGLYNETFSIDGYINNMLVMNSSGLMNGTMYVKGHSSAEEFWEHGVLGLSSGIDDISAPRWPLVLCLFGAWMIVFLCLIKGIRSSGRVAYVTVLAPYILLTVFLIRGAMLPGSLDGIIFFLTPDWTKLTEIQVWLEAAIQVFFSLGPAWGGLITMASYNRFNQNCFKVAVITTICDGATGVYGGLVISCVLGFMAHGVNTKVADVVKSGPGLALVAYPQAISQLPLPHLWAILFFLTLICLGLDSEFGMFESVCSGLTDQFPRLKPHKRLLTFALAISAFVIGLPFTTSAGMYIYQIIDWYAGTFSVITIALLECLVVGWIYGAGKFSSDVELMLGTKPSLFIRVCWTFITPVLLLACLIFLIVTYKPPTYANYTYPDWAVSMGLFLSVVSLIPIPVFVMYSLLPAQGARLSWKNLAKLLKPEQSWGPSKEMDRLKFQSMANRRSDTSLRCRVLGLDSDSYVATNGIECRRMTSEV